MCLEFSSFPASIVELCCLVGLSVSLVIGESRQHTHPDCISTGTSTTMSGFLRQGSSHFSYIWPVTFSFYSGCAELCDHYVATSARSLLLGTS